MRFLLEYPWPGNVRELQNSVSSMCAMANSNTVSEALLPQDGLNLKALEVAGGNKEQAARLLGLQGAAFRQREVDLVLEDRAGRVVGIEVKSSASLKADAAAGIKDLAESCGESFVRGVILYAGDEVIPFGSRVQAVPLPALWSW
jgi:hypothetical protein